MISCKIRHHKIKDNKMLVCKINTNLTNSSRKLK